MQTSVEIPPTLVSSRNISTKVGRAFYVIVNTSWYGHVYDTSLWMITIINMNLYLFPSLFKPICLSWVQPHSHSCSFMLKKCFKVRNGGYRPVLKWQCSKFVGLSHRTWLRSTSCVCHRIQGANPALSYNPHPPPTTMLVLTKTPRDSIPRLLHTRKRTKKRTRRTQSSHVFDNFFGYFLYKINNFTVG